MKKNILSSLLIFFFLLMLLPLLFDLFALNIAENTNIIIENNRNFENVINANTPVEIEVIDQRWGKTSINAPEVLFAFWNIFSNLNSYPQENISDEDLINGKVYFFDGSEKYFSLSNRFKLGDYYYGSREEEIEVKKLYNLIKNHLNTKNNLIEMLGQAAAVYLYPRNQFFDLNSSNITKLEETSIDNLIELIYQSEKIEYDNQFNKFILEKGYNPVYHLALTFTNKSASEDLIIISILSDKYFALTDMSQINRNITYFKGNIFSLVNQLFIQAK
jgi:hypothetical protein